MDTIVQAIEEYPVVPVFYNDDVAHCINVVNSCYKGGIRVFEFVNRGAFARKNFTELVAYKNEHWPDLKLGIGTIKTQHEATDFINLKADFIVSPIVNAEIAAVTLEKNVLWVPGAMTPTEIAQAEALGAPMVKLFPGDLLGPQFVKGVKPLFPKLKFMVTGGVSPEEHNIKNWFAAGVSAVGVGSKLFQDVNEEQLQLQVTKLLKWAGQR